MSRGFVFLCLGLALAGCAVKKRAVQAGQAAPVSSQLPKGLFISAGRKMLVRVNPLELVSGETNRVKYRFASSDLAPLSAADYAIEIAYDMPTMPEMGIFTPTMKSEPDGTLDVDYEISMPGVWQFRLKLSQHGKVVDAITYDFDVPTPKS